MRQLGPKQLKSLLLRSGEPCVSIYVSPSKVQVNKSSRLPLQSQLGQVRTLLHQHYPSDVGKILGPLAGLVENLQDFHLSTGLAIFKSVDFEGVFSVPDPSISRAVVADSFHIRPILTSIQRHDRFMIVLFDKDAELFYEGSEIGVVPMAELPANGRVILVGEASLRAKFLEKTRHVHQVISSIDLADDPRGDLRRLYQNTWPIARRWMRSQTARDIDEYRTMHPKGLATDNLYQIALAARSGRIKSLLLEKDVQIFGRINPQTGQPVISMEHARDDLGPLDDLLDDLAELVIATGGQVRVVESTDMPTASPLAATILPRTPTSWFKSLVG